MRKLRNILRLFWLCVVLAFMAASALSVAAERADRKQLPTRIGESKQQPTFWEDWQRRSSEMMVELFAAYLPGLVPDAILHDRVEPNSIEALRQRH